MLPPGESEDRWWAAHENNGQDKLKVHDLNRKDNIFKLMQGKDQIFAAEKYNLVPTGLSSTPSVPAS